MKVLHILYQSLPQISGSSIRSRDILMSQQEIGLDVFAITAPFQVSTSYLEIINDIRYIRTSINNEVSITDVRKPVGIRILRVFKILPFYFQLEKVILREKPNVLHAHAMFFCGLPSLFLARKFKVPVVYEVRSLWMLKKRKNNKKPTLMEQALLQIELYVMKKCDMVIALNENLKLELINQGVNSKKIMVINNAVNMSLISILRKNIVSKQDKNNGFSFGYIGTLTPHEGIDMLIESFKEINKVFQNSSLFIYGGGIEKNKIEELAKNNENIHFLGRISPDDVAVAYASMDAVVNPRYKNKLTETVTPLKPLEAMAYQKIFIGSDVGGIKELVNNKENGFLFEAGSHKALKEEMSRVIKLSTEERKRLTKRALNYVSNEKSWKKNALKYREVYSQLIENEMR